MVQVTQTSASSGAIRAVQLLPERYIRRIVEALNPVEIWLFGSRAKGKARPDSDWDVLAVLPDEAPESDFDIGAVWNRLRDLHLERVDVFPVRRSEFEEYRDTLGTLSQIVASEGVRCYAR